MKHILFTLKGCPFELLDDKEFSFNFKVENIKVLPGTYEVVVSQKLLSRFTSKNHDLTYYIALEPDSTFK